MWTNDADFYYDFGDDYYGEEYGFDGELLDYQNGLYLRLLQMTLTLWTLCL